MRLACLLLLPVLLLPASGCDNRSASAQTPDAAIPVSPPLKQRCTIEFKRDQVGLAAPTVLYAPGNGSENVSLTGRLLYLDADWLLLNEDSGDKVWIPNKTSC